MEKPDKSINRKEIQKYINILEDLNDKEKYSYNSLVKSLLENFGLRVKLDEIREIYEPTLEELEKDLVIQYNNVC